MHRSTSPTNKRVRRQALKVKLISADEYDFLTGGFNPLENPETYQTYLADIARQGEPDQPECLPSAHDLIARIIAQERELAEHLEALADPPAAWIYP